MADINPSEGLDSFAASMFESMDMWSRALDAFEGFVAQARDRGWSDEQARGIVYMMVTSKTPPEQPSQDSASDA